MRFIAKHSDLLDLLKREYARRKRTNPSYSLRAFAKYLEIESSWLSKILREKRPINPKLIGKFGEKLGLDPAQILELTARASSHEWPHEPKSNKKWMVIPQDVFEMIQDSNHYAILESMKLKEFQPDARWISSVLGVSPTSAKDCVSRLVRTGLLEIREDGSWYDRSEGFSTHVTGVNETSTAKRESQKRALQRSISALETLPIDVRDHSTLMMATHTSMVLRAKFMIEKFRRELCEFLESCPEKNTIYQASFSIFPIADAHPVSQEARP